MTRQQTRRTDPPASRVPLAQAGVRRQNRVRPPARVRPLALVALATLLSLVAFSPVAAQDDFVPEIPLTARFGVGARSLGMGGTGVAVVDDLSALDINPAALGLIRRTEMSLSMAHRNQQIDTRSGDRTGNAQLSKLRLNALGFAYPFPSYRGSLVLAGAVYHPRNLDRDVRRTLATGDGREYEFERGGTYNWRMGMAVMVESNLLIGGTLARFSGSEDRDFTFEDSASSIRLRDEASIRGWTGSIGALAMAGRRMRFGVTLHFPERYNLEGTQRIDVEQGGETTTNTVRFRDEIDLPFSIAGGVALTLPRFILTGDVRYADWREIDYAGPMRVGDQEAYRATANWHLGVEGFLPGAPVRLRAGFMYEPLPYRLLPDFAGNPENTILSTIDEEPAYWTIGVGGLVSRSLTIDLGIVHGGFKRSTDDYQEEVKETRVLVTCSYRG